MFPDIENAIFKNSLAVVSSKWQHIKYHALKNEGRVQRSY
jgi:hypothetical protein